MSQQSCYAVGTFHLSICWQVCLLGGKTLGWDDRPLVLYSASSSYSFNKSKFLLSHYRTLLTLFIYSIILKISSVSSNYSSHSNTVVSKMGS